MSSQHAKCPICKKIFKNIESHVEVEIARLSKLTQNSKRKERKYSLEEEQKTLKLLRQNYEKRNPKKKAVLSYKCFNCGLELPNDPDFVNEHIDACLSIKDTTIDLPETEKDSPGDWEEYEFDGETRVRASALAEGGPHALGYDVMNPTTEDVDVDIDEDDTALYGQNQFDEHDLRQYFQREKESTPLGNPGKSSKDLIIDSLKEKVKELVNIH